MTSAYVIYSRPFMRSFGVGRLEDVFIPPERMSDHTHLMDLRCTFYAHSDASQPPTFQQHSNGIIVISKEGQVQCALHEMRTLPAGLPLLLDMATVLLQKAHDEGQVLAQEIGLQDGIPDGVYHHNLEDAPAPLLVPTRD